MRYNLVLRTFIGLHFHQSERNFFNACLMFIKKWTIDKILTILCFFNNEHFVEQLIKSFKKKIQTNIPNA